MDVLKKIYLVYQVCLPALGISALFFLNPQLPAYAQGLPSAVWFIFGCVMIAAIAMHWVFPVEIEKFPTTLPSAIYAVLFVPVSLFISVQLSGDSIFLAIFLNFVVAMAGSLLGIGLMMAQKILSGDRNWFAIIVLSIGIIGGLLFFIFGTMSVMQLTTATIIGFAVSLAGLAVQRFLGMYKQTSNGIAADEGAVYILIGVAALFLIPGVVAVVKFWPAIKAVFIQSWNEQ